jgi:4-hydroxy-tetrahydrodipicolinate reductase
MGSEVIRALCGEPDTEVVGATEKTVYADHLALPDGCGEIPFSSDLERIITGQRPDVLVDFTVAAATMPAARIAAPRGVHLVIGTTGLTVDDMNEMEQLVNTNDICAVVAPNFTIGAVLMMHLASIAAVHMDHAEIIELHHDRKADAPSGTSLSTARAMARSRGKEFLRPPDPPQADSRGHSIDGITLHSVRLPGLLAHQEVILGAMGQTLTIRHDTISRESFMPGVILAVKEVTKRKGLILSLAPLLRLEEPA